MNDTCINNLFYNSSFIIKYVQGQHTLYNTQIYDSSIRATHTHQTTEGWA
uniref:Uncharacterized protein n=1 Tax=Arion vulgaris TaxID=1028688 RepID=A0A0B6YAM2_9EUPU